MIIRNTISFILRNIDHQIYIFSLLITRQIKTKKETKYEREKKLMTHQKYMHTTHIKVTGKNSKIISDKLKKETSFSTWQPTA